MTTPIRLSHNELSALLKSVFQACFGHAGDWAAMAHTVLWLEAHGFGGLNILMEAMDDNLCLKPFAGEITDTNAGYRVDFKGSHSMTGVHMMADLAVEAARKNGTGTVEIKSAADAFALVSALPACARYGVSAQAIGPEFCAHINMPDEFPALYDASSDSFILTCAAELSIPKGVCLQTRSELQSRYQETLMHGLPIDPEVYEDLIKVADRTLVEASEASRKGAGE